MPPQATSVSEYLASLPSDRRAALEAVRAFILKKLPRGYEEGMQYGIIGYYVPHSTFPAGYHCDPKQPLPFASLASQKNYMALHLMGLYMEGGGADDSAFRQAWAKTGKKLDMGKSCIRFKSIDDLALDVIADAIAKSPLADYVARYESQLARGKKGSAAAGAKKTPASATKKAAPSSAKKSAANAKGTAAKASQPTR